MTTPPHCEGSGSLGTPECSPQVTVPGDEMPAVLVPTTTTTVPAAVPTGSTLPLTGGDAASLLVLGATLVVLGLWVTFKAKVPTHPESGSIIYWSPEDGWD